MKNILIVTHHFPPEVNGTATRVYEIVKTLMKINPTLRIYVLAPVPSRPFGKFKQSFKLMHKLILHRGRVIVFQTWNIQPQLTDPPRMQRILNYILFPLLSLLIGTLLILISDLIIIIVPPTPICLFAILAKLFNKTIITDITDLWHEEAEYLGYVKHYHKLLVMISRGLEVLAIKLSKIITTASHTIMKYYTKFLSNKKFLVLPTPIDMMLVNKYCSEERLVDKDDLIIYAGNFGKPQALHLIIIALAVLHRNSKNIGKLVLIGGGEEEYRIRELINKLGLNKYVKIIPPVSREELFRNFYRKAKIGIVPLAFSKALIYAVPTKLYEYMMCGLPFVSYGSSLELKYIAMISRAGKHVSVNDPEKIAEALEYVNMHWRRLSINAKAFSNQLAKNASRILESLLSENDTE